MANFYLTGAEITAIHDQLIKEFGGTSGLLDQGRLEAAVFRPQTGYYNDLVEEAAALMESLANNNRFVDGNKRTCFASADTFLRMNGFFMSTEPVEAYHFITEAIASSTFRFPLIREWIAAHLQQL